MIDLIIPVYNNRKGLMSSLMSIGMDNIDLYVTVIDDCSTDTYDDIIKMFEHVFPIQYIKLNINSGPGIARNIGLSNTSEPYVTFLDSGDTFTAPCFIQHQMNIAQQYPDCVFFSWAHNDSEEGTQIPPIHNRIHGKIYKRKFLNQFNIRFNKNCPYYNEDIGFNIACRIAVNFLSEQNPDKIYMYENNESGVNWNYDENSISRKNNKEFYYHQSSYSFALNTRYAIDLLEQINIPTQYMLNTIYTGMAFLYTLYLEISLSRSEFLDDVLMGAVYYYENIFLPYSSKDPELIIKTYYNTLVDQLSDCCNTIRQKIIPLDYAGFLNICEEASKNKKFNYNLFNLKP